MPYAFLINGDLVSDGHALLAYGLKFARLLDLPEHPRSDVRMDRQLPERFVAVFAEGCKRAAGTGASVRLSGTNIDDEGGIVEAYQATFVPVTLSPNPLTCLIYGTFTCTRRGAGVRAGGEARSRSIGFAHPGDTP